MSLLRLWSEPSFPAEGYAALVHSEDSAVANGGASDISAQVLECRGAGTGRLDMDAPIFNPHLWIGVSPTGFKLSARLLTERGLQVRQMHEVIGLADTHQFRPPKPGNAGGDETPCAGSRYAVTAVKPLMCARSPLAAASFSANACELAAKNMS